MNTYKLNKFKIERILDKIVIVIVFITGFYIFSISHYNIVINEKGYLKDVFNMFVGVIIVFISSELKIIRQNHKWYESIRRN